jgi:integrase
VSLLGPQDCPESRLWLVGKAIVARRAESRARGDIHDVRQREATTVFGRSQRALLFAHLWGIVRTAPRTRELLVEDGVWIRLRDAFAFLVLLLTGLRRFEFCGLTCGAFVAADAKLWVVGKGKVKDYVPLPEPAVQLLARWLDLKMLRRESVDRGAPLFCATGIGGGEFLSLSALRLRWKQALAEAGLPTTFGLHATRHTAGLLAFAATGSIEKTARFLRHRDTATTARHYLHIDPDSLRAELSAVDLWRSP